MSKQTYIHVNGKLVEKEEAMQAHSVTLIRDIEPYQNMKDLGWISSRSHHREFLKKNNFIEVGNEQNHIFK
jgi:hypothetical protein|tara:strand:+ start:207 stop:419 length:213 start_codon:yes stop_codon:yes gene_type:complete